MILDTKPVENFINFGKKMQLPQTALLAIQGPASIPYFDQGTGWYPAFDDQGYGTISDQ